MKTFNRTELPKDISIKGDLFTIDIQATESFNKLKIPALIKAEAAVYGFKYVRVNVLSKKLRIRQSLTDKPHQPSIWIFTNKNKAL